MTLNEQLADLLETAFAKLNTKTRRTAVVVADLLSAITQSEDEHIQRPLAYLRYDGLNTITVRKLCNLLRALSLKQRDLVLLACEAFPAVQQEDLPRLKTLLDVLLFQATGDAFKTIDERNILSLAVGIVAELVSGVDPGPTPNASWRPVAKENYSNTDDDTFDSALGTEGRDTLPSTPPADTSS